MDARDNRSEEVERELGDDEAELAEIQATLERLRQVRRRIAQGQLELGDWVLFGALVDEMMETM